MRRAVVCGKSWTVHGAKAACCALLFAVLPAAVLRAAPDAGESRELTLQLSSLPEAKLSFALRYAFPLLQGDGPLTKDNSITAAFTADISPVSLNGGAETVWTPAAFCQLSAGGKIGSGWVLDFLGTQSYGAGLNRPDPAGGAEYAGSAFDGALIKLWTGGALQFDLAALFPGEWNHIVARSYHEISYRRYTAAQNGESWYCENDDGENVNGASYYGNLLIAYRMPLALDTVGFFAEAELDLSDTPGMSVWGGDRVQWIFSGLFNFTVTDSLSAALILQLRTRRNYRETAWSDLYYRNRTLDTSRPLRLEWYRAAAVLSYRF